MSIRFSVLGSGSSGNCTLVMLASGLSRRLALIDAGLGPRTTTRRLARFGVGLDEISDILVTHLDLDHFRSSWIRTCLRRGIRVHLHRRHHRRSPAAGVMRDLMVPFDRAFSLEGGTNVDPIMLPHGALGTTGFVIEHEGVRLGWATDVGRVQPDLIDHFVGLDALAIESNYDRTMQVRSGRPASLKRRIMGGSGHLSNEQSLKAVVRIAARSRLGEVALLHISRECNDPQVIHALYRERAPRLLPRVRVTSQLEPTPIIEVHGGASEVPVAEPVPVQGLLF